jgi:polyhydroxyalkanoate synthase
MNATNPMNPSHSHSWMPFAHIPCLEGVRFFPDRLQAVQQQFLQETTELWQQFLQGQTSKWTQFLQADRRFTHSAWHENTWNAYWAASYLLGARTLMRLVDAVDAPPKTLARLRFTVQQSIDAASPANFLALNPEAQKKAIETQGASLQQGLINLWHDLGQGHLSQTDESAFEVGKNLAITEGAVVFENAFFQLIEYKPLTPEVHSRPLLIIPPCINKFYILDLQPHSSLVRYAVSQGHRTFMLSWRNADASLIHATWENYVEDAVMTAIQTVQRIADVEQINALGFCIGGTLLACALAILTARGQQIVASATFLTTLLDFSNAGILDVFIDESIVTQRENQFQNGGLLKGQELATTFAFLRPNDLVWNYVVGNYLKGESPPPFDLLYWNGDNTNLPGPMYAWYLRHTYLENQLIKPGAITLCAEPIDLSTIQIPSYIYGSREDHIVPAHCAYACTQVLGGKKRFVLGASGHIAGVVNPPLPVKRCHWTGPLRTSQHRLDQWLKQAEEHPGSWWPDWASWLQTHGGPLVKAPTRYGKGKTYAVIEPAPGRYVRATTTTTTIK